MKKAFKNSGFKAPRQDKEVNDCKENTIHLDQIKIEKDESDGDVMPDHHVPKPSDGEGEENISSAAADKKSKIKNTNAAKQKKSGQKVMRSLTDEEYDEIFSAALSRGALEDITETINKPSLDSDAEDSRDLQAGIFDFRDELEPIDKAHGGHSDSEFEEMDFENLPEDIKAEVITFDAVESPEHLPRTIGTLTPVKSKPLQKVAHTSVSMKHSLETKQEASPRQVKKPSFGVKTKVHAEDPRQKEAKVTSEVSTDKKKLSKKKFERREKMKERKIEETGTWVQCTKRNCLKWRFLAELHDPATLPDVWTCAMNPDHMYNSCELPEEKFDEDEHSKEYVFTRYTEGSLVWARMTGYPWWPAMVEIDPDFENYFECKGFDNVASHYHVVFFDDRVSRAWISSSNLIPFAGSERNRQLCMTRTKHGDFKKVINEAKEKAQEAQVMPIKDRLKEFSFAKRYKGRWGQTSDGSQESGSARKKRSKKRQQKTKERSSNNRSSGVPVHSEIDCLPDDVDVLQSQSEEDLFSSAEALLQDAEDVLGEFFSSQKDDEPSEDDEPIPVKKPKKSNKNKPANEVLSMDVVKQADEQTPKASKKSKSSTKNKTPVKDDHPLKHKTLTEDVKKREKKNFHAVPIKKTTEGDSAKQEKSNKTAIISEQIVDKTTEEASNDEPVSRQSQTDAKATNSQASNRSTKPDENNNNPPSVNSTAPKDEHSQSSAKNTNIETDQEKIASSSQNKKKVSKKFSAPVVKKSASKKSEDISKTPEGVANTKEEAKIQRNSSQPESPPHKRVLRSSQSQSQKSDDLDLDLNTVTNDQSQNNVSSQDLDLSQILKDEPVKTVSETVDEDSEPLDFEE